MHVQILLTGRVRLLLQIADLIGQMSALDGMSIPSGSGGLNITAAAEGGHLRKGQLTLVGERGPELFTPKRSGWIIPNDEAFGNGRTEVHYHIDVHDNYGDSSIDQAIERKVKNVIQEAQMFLARSNIAYLS